MKFQIGRDFVPHASLTGPRVRIIIFLSGRDACQYSQASRRALMSKDCP